MIKTSFARPVRAVLFDVDGTLYHQAPLRLLMGIELASLPLTCGSLPKARRTWRAIGTFRKVREELRALGAPAERLDALQLRLCGERTGVDPCSLESILVEWIYRRPLKYLDRCRRAGIDSFLAYLRRRALPAGALSDYPVADKLAALGLTESFAVQLCTTDPEINAFKPHPRGFLRACEILGLPPGDVLFVGDRADVDAAGACACGMPCAIFSRRRRRRAYPQRGFVTVTSFEHLQHAVDNAS